MKKLMLAAILCLAVTTPAFAHRQEDKHALGNMYTKVLNMIESRGMLDTLEPKATVAITDMHMDHGQVFVTLALEGGPSVVVFDPIANRIVQDSERTN